MKSSMYKVMKSFICRGCVNPITGTARTSVDIGDDSNLELDKFCYLGDMLSVDRDADAAVETRIRIEWNKLRQLVPLLTIGSEIKLRQLVLLTMLRYFVLFFNSTCLLTYMLLNYSSSAVSMFRQGLSADQLSVVLLV